MWHAFVQWFSTVIQFMYGITQAIGVPSYGLAIIFMTIAIKLVLFPLSQKQMKSMRGMQEIQPRMKQIQENFKDEPELMQRKLTELYKETGVSPFAGCLPLIIQMPIFIAFYQSLLRLEFKVAEHAAFLWIPSLGERDPFFIMAILAAGTTFLQQRVTMVNTNDPTQRTMLYVMPLFMAWIAATLPAGLPLYWVMFNILGILQQLYVNWGLKKAKLDTGTGIKVDVPLFNEPMKAGDGFSDKNKTAGKTDSRDRQKAAGRDKGGKKLDGRSDYRKKRKKR